MKDGLKKIASVLQNGGLLGMIPEKNVSDTIYFTSKENFNLYHYLEFYTDFPVSTDSMTIMTIAKKNMNEVFCCDNWRNFNFSV